MNYTEHNTVENLKIAYVGGGSRGWAWGLMSDLANATDISGEVCLYDIDFQAAKNNEIIGNSIARTYPEHNNFSYKAVETLDEALEGADFVVISILPGTFDEMESDVHAPEKYGIYQSVGDTVGPGGIIRALRTIPMFEVIANAIRRNCPDAWVINYTNPMSVCVRTLYRVFPEIKAFGCCHEVFGTQNFLAKILKEQGNENVSRQDIKINVLGINHFTWITSAHYKNLDLFPIYRQYCKKNHEIGCDDGKWINDPFRFCEKVKMDLFLRYGVIAAAGDRHLAEFCPGKWYLNNPETVKKWKFGLTPVSHRKKDLQNRLEKSRQYLNGEKVFELKKTGEEGVLQIRAILGLGDIVTNVNLPNYGQISNLPSDAIVETNAYFTCNSVTPVIAGAIPNNIMSLISPQVYNQECTVQAGLSRDLELAYNTFMKDPLVTIGFEEGRKLFDEMVDNTAAYLGEYLK